MKFLSILLTSLLLVGTAQAASLTQAETKNAEVCLNKASPECMRKHQLGSLVLSGKKQVMKLSWDYATQGGASGTAMQLRSSAQTSGNYLPKGAIVSDCIIDIRQTIVTANGASMNIGTGQSSADLKNALSASAATGLVACIPVGTAASSVKLTDNRIPQVIFTSGTVTAGQMSVLIEYWLSDSP
jgi:hypothetical protein